MLPRFSDFTSALLESSNADVKRVYDQARDQVMTARLSMEVFYQGEEVAVAFHQPQEDSWGRVNSMVGARAKSKWSGRNDGKYDNAWGDSILLPKKSFDKFMAGLRSAHIEIENARSSSRVVLMRSWEDVDAVLRAIDAA